MASFDGFDSKSKDSFDLTRIVKIRVGTGDDAKEYLVHEGMLDRSEFFRRALQGEWKEAQTRSIDLPEDEAAIVEQYLRLMYVGRISLKKEPHPLELEESRRHCKNEMHKLSKLYVFAEKVQDGSTKNMALSALMEVVEHGMPHGHMPAPPPSVVQTIYGHTVAGDMARKFLVDFYVCYGLSGLLHKGDSHTDELPAEFTLELSCALLDLSKAPRKSSMDTPFAKKHEYKKEE